jgi:ATP-dependent Lhr-like helicase
MARTPPDVLVTTPESLAIMLTSDSGRAMLRTVRTAIVDEIHAVLRDKRGSHLALSLERLEALAGPYQRIGLSATQKPLEDVGRFLVGSGVPGGRWMFWELTRGRGAVLLATVCSHEQWEEIYGRMAELVRGHRTTLVFVNTRKMAERIAAQLTKILGEEAVTSHHGSLSRERRLDAEQRLKSGSLRALVATASWSWASTSATWDLVVQVGAARSVATLLQRVGLIGPRPPPRAEGPHLPLTSTSWRGRGAPGAACAARS